MKYLDLLTGDILKTKRILIRRGSRKDIKDTPENTAVPLYVIEKDSGKSKCYAHSDIELLIRLAGELQLETYPVEADIQFESDEGLYPDRDPRYGVETILELQGRLVGRQYREIEENPNPFTSRVRDVLTMEKAQKIGEQIKVLNHDNP
ncbi:hypothetical protein CMI37_27050 [Candidatus Pacearchaeota archaeon]|nr:hypothetical protein [Candidatus Pacearchaeota archaeon]|tara:strand:+ start:108 stop:554 length:447 start_codon:yes stop_codon:yes gene_type:complete